VERDLRIRSKQLLIPPEQMEREIPLTWVAEETVSRTRGEVEAIRRGIDDRIIFWTGPCSVHDIDAVMDYAVRLAPLADEVRDRILIIIRLFFEKGRSGYGWPGLVVDPYLDGSNEGLEGLKLARQLLVEVNSLGLPAGTELIDPFVADYLAELLSIAVIGARMSESSMSRRLASGLSMTTPFKNGTDGSLDAAIGGMIAAGKPQAFFGNDYHTGRGTVLHTNGNTDTMLVLRGGTNGPNYSADSLLEAVAELDSRGLCDRVGIDINHANSGRDHERQELILQEIIADLPRTRDKLALIIAESFLEGGKQPFDYPCLDPTKLKYGQSITDACAGWEQTMRMITSLYEALP
jgi:3-deoxy-7-phosphoheptulonate synthase